jgi:hypothetical protein
MDIRDFINFVSYRYGGICGILSRSYLSTQNEYDERVEYDFKSIFIYFPFPFLLDC